MGARSYGARDQSQVEDLHRLRVFSESLVCGQNQVATRYQTCHSSVTRSQTTGAVRRSTSLCSRHRHYHDLPRIDWGGETVSDNGGEETVSDNGGGEIMLYNGGGETVSHNACFSVSKEITQ